MLRLPRVININTLTKFSTKTNPSLGLTSRKFSALPNVNKTVFIKPAQNSFQFKPLGASKVLALATFTTVTTPVLLKKPVQCQGVAIQANETFEDAIKDYEQVTAKYNQPLFRKGELSFGTFIGLCTGYLLKKVGRVFVGFVGATFVFLQYMAYKGFITVHWDVIEGSYINNLDVDRDGKVTKRDLKSKWNTFIGILTNNFQFKSTFLVGLYTSLRYA